MKNMIKAQVELKVLCVEDVLKDAEIMKESIADAGYHVNMDIATGKKEYLSLIKGGKYDIILADYTLPGFDAHTALKLALEEQPDVPFICVSGTIGEDKAVELLKQGASDYVLKDRLGRLPFAVKEAMKKKSFLEANRKTQQDLNESEAKFRAVAELSPMAVYASFGTEQKATHINEAFYKIFGFSIEDVPTVGDWWIKAFPDEKYRQKVKDKWAYNIEQAKRNNKDVEGLECVCTCKDGSEKIIVWVGKTIGEEFWAYGYDITERKKADEKLAKQNEYVKMILDNFPIGIATNEIDSMKVTYMNRKFSEIYGWPEDEFPYIGNFFEKVFPDIEYRQQMQTRILEDLSSGDMERMNWDNLKIATKAGEQRIVHAFNIPLLNQNIMVSTVQDITKRKHAEEVLKKEQALSNAIIESIPGTFYMLDETGQYVRWNAYQRDEIVGKSDDLVGSTNALDTIHPDDREFIQSKIVNVLANGAVETVEGRVLLRGGPAARWLVMTGTRMLIDGHPFLVGIGIDITERKMAEEELKDKLEELQRFHDVTVDREIHMIELKKEVNELLKKAGEPHRYKIVE